MPGYCPGRSSFGHHRCVTPLCCKPMWNFNCVFRLRFVKRNRESLTPQCLPMSLRLAGHVAPVKQKGAAGLYNTVVPNSCLALPPTHKNCQLQNDRMQCQCGYCIAYLFFVIFSSANSIITNGWPQLTANFFTWILLTKKTATLHLLMQETSRQQLHR